jgi:hypothetical protein
MHHYRPVQNFMKFCHSKRHVLPYLTIIMKKSLISRVPVNYVQNSKFSPLLRTQASLRYIIKWASLALSAIPSFCILTRGVAGRVASVADTWVGGRFSAFQTF